MIILGLNAYHGDSAACILVDGRLIAAVEEERIKRLKHWAGFPAEAVRYCLQEAGVRIEEVDHIALNRNPSAHLWRKAVFALQRRPSPELIRSRVRNAVKTRDIRGETATALGAEPSRLKARVHWVEHHLAHLASAFLVSPFEKAAVVSVDGFGDFVGAMWGEGQGEKIDIRQRIFFPNSLGLFYQALTQFLGFPRYGDEYKVMGMAAYGEPVALPQMREIVRLNGQGDFRLDPRCFRHHSDGAIMSWDGCEPVTGTVFSRGLERLLGPARHPEEPIDLRHKQIAASTQARYEEAFFHLLNEVYRKTQNPNLCLAGGCALNSLANGKIFERTPFTELYIQPAAGDAGGALGAACHLWNQVLGKRRDFVMKDAYWGPGFTDGRIREEVDARREELLRQGCSVAHIPKEGELCRITAAAIATGKIVGWFQGRMEWGPRALGNRSILVDPRREDMKDTLNARIKRRESFRPFAPAILQEKVGEYFTQTYPDPFMLKVYPIRPEKRSRIPAVTHVDGTGRLQTVAREENPIYWRLLKEFENLTGVPVLLNTSFNENEPIVCTPAEALNCFQRTKMDGLVLGNWMIQRRTTT